MKKRNSKIMTLLVGMSLMAGSVMQPALAEESKAVKTGLSVVTTLSGESASEEKEGTVKTDSVLVAVTVDEEGVIDSCVIDMVQANVTFSDKGELTDADTEFLSKNELSDNYGMKQASSIGKEWNEQAAAMAEYAVGKTVEELKNGAVDENGKAKDADLASSATIHLGGFISGIEAAVNNAEHLGAGAGDELTLTSLTDSNKSMDATAEEDGAVKVDSAIAAVTMNGETITSCIIDSVQTEIPFNAEGVISGEFAETAASKNELGEEYGLKQASSIGKEWNEQAAAFCEYVTGKTAEEAAGIAVSESGDAEDADLAASVTISIGDFMALIEKAAK